MIKLRDSIFKRWYPINLDYKSFPNNASNDSSHLESPSTESITTLEILTHGYVWNKKIVFLAMSLEPIVHFKSDTRTHDQTWII